MFRALKKIDDYFGEISKRLAFYVIGDYEGGYKSEVLAYGFSVFLKEILKFILLLVIFCVLGYKEEFLFILFNLVILRIFVGGTHRETSVGCFFQSLITISLVLVLANSGIMIYDFSFVVALMLLICVILFAPVISDKRAAYSYQKRKKFKTIAVFIIIIQTLLGKCFTELYHHLVIDSELTILVELYYLIIKSKFKSQKKGVV